MARLLLIAVLLALVVPALAYDWQFEQVDTVGRWSSPSLRLSGTGVLHFCYRAQGNTIVHSYLDSVWHHEEIVPPDTLGGYAMDVGPHGEFGLVLHLSSGYWLYEKQDTSWRRDSIPVPLGYFMYDSGGAPSGVFMVGDAILYSRRADSTWVSETVVVTPEWYYYHCGPLTYTVKGEPCVVITGEDWSYQYFFIDLYIKQADTWRDYVAASAGYHASLDYVGCAPDTGDGAAVLYNYSDDFDPYPGHFHYRGFGTGGGTLGTPASAGVVAVHSSGVPHVAYIVGQLRYACRVGTTWYLDTISAASSLQLAGIVLEDSLPTIGFIDPATGVWLARRLPVGVQEMPWTTVETVNALPTIVRGVLFLPTATIRKPQAARLLDISGRKVRDLKPGANDVRALAPGVYFVREEPQASSSKPQAMRKIVLTE